MHAGFFFKKNLNINLMEKNMKLYNMQKLHYLVWIWKTITMLMKQIVLLSNKLSFFLFSLIQCTIDSFYYVQDYDRNHPVGNEKDENNTI